MTVNDKSTSLRALSNSRATKLTTCPEADGFMPPSQRVMAAVSRHTGIPGEVVLGPSRLRPIVVARRIAAYILRHRYGWSSTRIAKTLNRDHTTILTGLKRMPNYLSNPKYARQMSAVSAELQLSHGFTNVPESTKAQACTTHTAS